MAVQVRPSAPLCFEYHQNHKPLSINLCKELGVMAITSKVNEKSSDFKTKLVAIAFLVAIFWWTAYTILSNSGIFSLWAYGDAQMLNAGIHFAREGFLANNFLPLVNPGSPHSLVENNGTNGRYFHYPALHALVVGVIVKLVDLIRSEPTTSLEEIKNFAQLFFALISVTALYLNFLWLKNYVSNTFSILGLITITLSGFYTNFGISLCDQPLHYLFFSINLILISKLLNQATLNLFSNRRLNLIICVNLFFATRNSIETPILIFTLNVAAILIFDFQFRVTCIKWVLKFQASPILLAIVIQFVQARLEFATFADFYNHWRNLSATRFSLSEIGNLNMILKIFDKYSMPQFVIFLLCVITLLIVKQRTKKSSTGKKIFESILLAYIFSLFVLILLLPRQMFYMSDYVLYYFNFATVMTLIILSKYLLKFRYLVIFTILFIELISLSSSGKSALALRQDPKFLEFTSVFEHKSRKWWGGSDTSWKSIPLLKSQFFDTISRLTESKDLIVLPERFRGNSTGESNSVLEFYIQRHAITSQDNIQLNCRELIEKVPGVPRIHTFDDSLTKFTTEIC